MFGNDDEDEDESGSGPVKLGFSRMDTGVVLKPDLSMLLDDGESLIEFPSIQEARDFGMERLRDNENLEYWIYSETGDVLECRNTLGIVDLNRQIQIGEWKTPRSFWDRLIEWIWGTSSDKDR